VWPPIDHFERLIKGAYPNHAYPIQHEPRDYDMMKNFMTSGSLTKNRKLMEDPGGSDTTPFSAEDVIMMVYVGRPPSGRHHMSNLSPRTSAAVGDTGSQGCKGTNFPISLYIYICEYVYYYRCFLHWQETGGQDNALQF
jgi:hypothetical protein